MMKCTHRGHLLFALMLLAGASAGAETLAVAVRLANGPADEPRLAPLLASIEEGAMEALFARGHIVFDIDLGEASELTRFQAIELARAGGASFLMLIDATFKVTPGRPLVPSVTIVTVVRVSSGRERVADPVDPGTLPEADNRVLDALLLDIGASAAEHALTAIGEGQGTW